MDVSDRNSGLDISVLIATYNRAEILRQTLESMTDLDREGLAVEFVVVDNNSSDHTKQVVESFSGKLPIRYLFESRPGKNCALNKALDEVALAKLVVFTDDDVDPRKDWLKAVVSASRHWPRFSVFGGKQFLEEELKIPVTIFIPPWNSYDYNTIRALEQSGFQCLSAGSSGPSGSPSSLKFLPVSCGPADIKNAVEAARNIPDPAPVVTILFHAYEFKDVNKELGKITYDDFLDMLSWLSVQKDVSVKLICQLSNIGRDRYTANRAVSQLSNLLPRRLRWKGGEFVFLSLKGAQSVKSRQYALVFVFYASVLSICAILSFAFGTTVFSRVPVLSKFILFVGLVVLLVGSIYTFHDLNVGMKGLAAIAGVLGCCIGTFGARCWTLRHRRQVS